MNICNVERHRNAVQKQTAGCAVSAYTWCCLAQSSDAIHFSLLLSLSSRKYIFVRRNAVPLDNKITVISLTLQGVTTHTQTHSAEALQNRFGPTLKISQKNVCVTKLDVYLRTFYFHCRARAGQDLTQVTFCLYSTRQFSVIIVAFSALTFFNWSV